MQKLVQGIHHFQANIFRSQRDLFERLAHGQQPDALFVTCSDSRINPNLITQTEPGDLFILRNAGNIIPPHGAANGGEGATIEYAISVLKRSEEHTSELQSLRHLVCRLLLEKKKTLR